MPRAASSSWTTLSSMVLPRFFTSSLILRFSGSEKVWKDTPPLASRDLSAATVAQKPSAVSGTSTRRSALIWAVSPLRHVARSQARKPRVSLTPNENWRLVSLLSCRDDVDHGGLDGSGAGWHATQRP
jgi:hypothetical protein